MQSPVQQYLTETTVHGLVHFTGPRRPYVRLVWAAAFAISFSFCCLRINDAVVKFIVKETATAIKENALDFQFPDVYICNENPISGSYSVHMDPEATDELARYRRLVNASVATMNINATDIALDNYAIRLVNTLPFAFLSDNLGQRPRSILFDCLLGECDAYGAMPLYHPAFINCFRLNITEVNRSFLQNPSNSMQLFLFVDQLLPSFDAGPAEDVRRYFSESIALKPVDWDLNAGTDFSRPTGFRIYLTPQGQHPSNQDAQIFAGPGMQHRVQIRMQDTVYSEADFSNQCLGENDLKAADFMNPYDGQRVTFKYSQAVCWFREVARLSQQELNCSVVRQPIPWEYRSLASCFNVSAPGYRHLPLDIFYRPAANLVNRARRSCDNQTPCRSRSYSFQYSSSSWPSRRIWQDFLKIMIKQLDVDDKHLGIQFLINNSTFTDVKESLLQIELSALSPKSQEFQLSMAYSFNSLIADVGGLLGLFLGMSLLSALELFELAHNWALMTCKTRCSRRRRETSAAATLASSTGCVGGVTCSSSFSTGELPTVLTPDDGVPPSKRCAN